MFYECDTCDLVFDTDTECQQHMSAIDHAASSDTCDHRIPTRTSSTASEDTSGGDSFVFSDTPPDSAPKVDEKTRSLAYSSLNNSGGDGSDDGERGVSIPASALEAFAEPDRSSVAFTKQWVADQQAEKSNNHGNSLTDSNWLRTERHQTTEPASQERVQLSRNRVECKICDTMFKDNEGTTKGEF